MAKTTPAMDGPAMVAIWRCVLEIAVARPSLGRHSW
jgi:hypothetical protein